jgi:target of rapamycin complex 2 subunit MAPKAP1/AVO1
LTSYSSHLIHSIRLAYLRHVDDPYGPRILSLNPGYSSNAHIIASGLADQELWPEIVLPSTPAPVDKDSSKDAIKRHSGFPGATGLKYSQTIVGHNRTGALGMRVNAKRGSLIREAPPVQAQDSETSSTRHRSDSADASELEEAPTSSGTAGIESFKPPFPRAAEMEERRQTRMRSRFASAGNEPRPTVTLGIQQQNPEASEDESSSGDDSELLGNDMPLEGEDAVEDEFYDPYVLKLIGALLLS